MPKNELPFLATVNGLKPVIYLTEKIKETKKLSIVRFVFTHLFAIITTCGTLGLIFQLCVLKFSDNRRML